MSNESPGTPTFSMSYAGNGSTAGSAPVDPGAYPSGTVVEVLSEGSLVKAGWSFSGWNTHPDGSGTGYAPGSTFTMVGDVTVYAQWVETPENKKALTAFSLSGFSPAVTGLINQTTHTITLTVPFGTDQTSLVAVFTTTGAQVAIGAVPQISGTTANNFSTPVTYTVTASNGTAQSYLVSVAATPLVSGTVSTFAGSLSQGYADGVGSAARFYAPYGIASDGVNLYVADTYNHEIRQIVIATAAVTTLAGFRTAGQADGIGSAARFNQPEALATDGVNVYVADSENEAVRKVEIATGQVTTLAGSFSYGHTDGTGSAASFGSVDGIATDGTYVYVSDGDSIRKIVIATGVVTTLLSSSGSDFEGLATDGVWLYAADVGKFSIQKIALATAQMTTLAGSSSYGVADGTGSLAAFYAPRGIVLDGPRLYVADANRVRKIVIATAVVTTAAGSGGTGHADGVLTGATFNGCTGVAVDGLYVYVTDSSNYEIRRVVK